MNCNEIPKWIIIFIISISIIAIIGSGVWLLYQPSDMCLGDKSIGMMYGVVAVGFSLIFIFICCLSCGCCGKDDGRMMIATSCSSFGLLVIIIYVSVYAFIYSTLAFGSLQKEITSPESWMDIKHCLYQQTQLCSDFQRNYANDSPHQFFARHFPLIQVILMILPLHLIINCVLILVSMLIIHQNRSLKTLCMENKLE